MTCAHFEKDLALYAERDLQAARRLLVEAHLGECPGCRLFLDDVRASQSLVHGLATESVAEDALAGVRARVIAGSSVPASPTEWRAGSSSTAVWGAAALAVVVVTAGVIVWRGAGEELEERRGVEASIGTTTASSRPQRPTMLRSTNPSVATVSPYMERLRGSRGGVDRAHIVPVLSRDDADQLARAVVAVSQIRSAHDRRPDPDADPSPDAASTPLMRVATTDASVAIYWQLDPSGGE